MGEEKVYIKKDWGQESFFLLNFGHIFCQTKYFGPKKFEYAKQFDKNKLRLKLCQAQVQLNLSF